MIFFLILVSDAVLTSTHNLCFKIRKYVHVYRCKAQFYYIKVGCKGVYIARHVIMTKVVLDETLLIAQNPVSQNLIVTTITDATQLIT